MDLPHWIAISDFRPTAPTSLEAGERGTMARKGRHILNITYTVKGPKGQNDRAPRSDAIAVFAISTPLTRGVKKRAKQARVGSVPFTYINKINV